jgi:hypothetical protein
MSRLRTLSETYQHLKALDSETAVTPNALRRMVVSGKLPCVRIGKKYLIDIDTLFDDLKTIRPEEVLPGYRNPLRRM